MKLRLLSCALGTAAAMAVAAAEPAAPQTLVGFTAADGAAQRSLEERFDSGLDAKDLSDWLKRFAAEPNHVGSPHDKANAEAMRDMLRSWGWDTDLEVFQVLYPTPIKERLELVAPGHFVASLRETAIPGDATSARTDGLPPYNAYGGDGDVTAPLIYVNYGMDDDYRELARRGIDPHGKIVIVRYGSGWRGLKPKLAQEHGAVGCIIYSDPREDGYASGDTYPTGGWRPPQGVQRGSVLDMPVYAGDPLTPGVGATQNAKRLPISEAKTILKIPVIPISYADAKPLLAALAGPVAPPAWRGALPLTYHLGPGPARVHLLIKSDWSLKPLYDVIARIEGSVLPDEWVIRGNHHDGWVAGAWDPLSGAVAELAEAKSIGALVKAGWRPQRTLIYASWDGEEPGLLGSTEWAEAHADELEHKAVLYVNTDDNGRGFLAAGGSHTLQRLVNQVADGVKDPETGVSVLARQRARALVLAYESKALETDRRTIAAAAGTDLPLNALGSGSDYTPFIQHLGITSLNFEYTGEDDQSGVYHSLYDTFDHYVRFGDPGFLYGIALAKVSGHAMLRTAQADILPLEFSGFADTLESYRHELHALTDERRKSAEELAKLLDQNAFKLAADPTRVVAPPERLPVAPYLNFAAFDNAVARIQKLAKSADEAEARALAAGTPLPAERRRELDDLLRGMEQALTDPNGLPGRPWYRHLLYAPGLLTGYGAKTVPGVREAIEADRWDEANEYLERTARLLEGYADRLERARQLLAG